MDSSSVQTVSQITDQIRLCLNGEFADVWVSGEVSSLKRPHSGHLYLNLKDDQAQLATVIWRSTAARLKFQPEDGMQVLCRGYVDVYPQRGSYQLIVQSIQPLGAGALQLAFRQLHERLKKEGLFEAEFKQPLPSIPRRVVVITSPSGAAIHDFLQVVNRRWPHLDILVYPVKVQGPEAANEIAAAIAACGRQFSFDPDVIVLTRGGGSIEDLWAFNEERVVRAIFDCQIPIVSAVGHEIDVTLSDLVADMRALTPSEAGEKLVPDVAELVTNLRDQRQRLQALVIHRLTRVREQLAGIVNRPVLRQPLQMIQKRAQQLDSVDARLPGVATRRLELTRHRLDRFCDMLKLSAAGFIPDARLKLRQIANSTGFQVPQRLVEQLSGQTVDLERGLLASIKDQGRCCRQQLLLLEEKLNAFDPGQVLKRGYSLTLNARGRPVVSCQTVHADDKIQTWLSDGRLASRVEEIEVGLNYVENGEKEN